jgi:hypothetical protein
MISPPSPALCRRVQTGHQSLGGGFFIAGGAVDLAGQEKPGNTLCFKGMAQLTRIDVVIFDGVARPHHAGPLEAGNCRQKCDLHLLRQRGRDPVRIDRRIVQPLGLQEDLMAVALAEADDLVLDRGAIARAAALDLPGIHRRTMHIGPDNGVRSLGGAGDAALNLRDYR